VIVATPPDKFSTARLTFRRPVAEDAQAIYDSYGNDPVVARFMAWRPEGLDGVRTFLRRCDEAWASGTAWPYAIMLGDRLIGTIELRLVGHRAELGYALSQSAWGQGYASEAACAIMELALAIPGVRRVWAYHDVENAASGRVLEKTGMEREGLLRAWFIPPIIGHPRDCWVYARIKNSLEPPPAPPSLAATVAASPPASVAHREDPPIIESERLVLRRPTERDAPAVFDAYARDPAVSRYLTWTPHRGIEGTRGYLRQCDVGWQRGTLLTWLITMRDDRVIGAFDMKFEGHRAEIGYALARAAWGQGYATEAARAVMRWARTLPELNRVWAVCDVDNPASARVLEKIGMTREARLRAWAFLPAFGRARDVWCYASILVPG
jgi:RimJ/RimL family protein N-acetyltransferase